MKGTDGGEWSISCPHHFTSQKEPQYPYNRRLNGIQSWSAHFGEEKNLLPLAELEPQMVQPIT